MSELSTLIQALSAPDAYPHHPRAVRLVQTQISLVFLAGDLVYKVKKPVAYDFLDFTTLSKRRFYCHQEVRLNRRLCPDIYLGVASITRSGDTLAVEGTGSEVECAVKMRTLPEERMMDRLLRMNRVTPDMVNRVAEKLAAFHQHARISEQLALMGGPATIEKDLDENFAEVEQYVDRTITPEQYETTREYSHEFLTDEAGLFEKRVSDGRIRDCHGDLRAAHVCFTEDICIFDCIEFNERFRYIDVANEIAFLAMDLDFLGHADLARHFVHSYMEVSGDEELFALLNFYKCYRAFVRGKVEGFKLDDPDIPEEEKKIALDAARRYFALAEQYAEK